MTDLKSLPNDHPLKPLELRMLEMATDMGPLMVAGGNFVAALRVFAAQHPGLYDFTTLCESCGVVFGRTDHSYKGWWYRCPDCGEEAA